MVQRNANETSCFPRHTNKGLKTKHNTWKQVLWFDDVERMQMRL